MRTDQMIGLNDRGRKLIEKLVAIRDIPFEGAWNTMYLNIWGYPGGRGMPSDEVYEEFVQVSPWSSGPCYFLALKIYCTGVVLQDTLWSEEEITLNL